MQNLFQFVLDNYIDDEVVIDSNSRMFHILTKELPLIIDNSLNRKDLLVVGSMGKGMKTSYPWISILNTSITKSTQKGLYIVYLFKRDMSGFYLALSQGITNFDNLFKSKKYEYATKVANYFASQINSTLFTNKSITLGNGNHDLGYGYERATIISKFYSKSNFSSNELFFDLQEMLKIYDQIIRHLSTSSYDQIIKWIINGDGYETLKAEIAINEIKKTIDPNNDTPAKFERNLIEVSPQIDRTTKFSLLTNPKVRKTDYLHKTMKDLKIGLIGEELVMWYEIKRLRDLGLEYYSKNIKWCSMESDQYGYDIQSFDICVDGVIRPIMIEVKATSSKLDTEFFITQNELEASKKFKKSYYIYRVYDINSQNPKFYRACGEVEDNFILDPISYKAKYKF